MELDQPRRSVNILGVRVDDVTYGEALDVLRRQIVDRRIGMVITPNTEIVMRGWRDTDYGALLNSATLAIPDGIGLIVAAHLLGQSVREHVRGTDLVERLAAVSAIEGHRFFLLGAADGVAVAAAEKLRTRFQGLSIAGCFGGSADPEGDRETLAAIRAAGRVDVLLVAYGAPKQERWIARNQALLGVPVAIGVGGVLDFFSGRAKRAPEWVRKVELEWLYRLLRQPSRWRRQLALLHFAALIAREWIRLRLNL